MSFNNPYKKIPSWEVENMVGSSVVRILSNFEKFDVINQ